MSLEAQLKLATERNELYDFIANHYYEMSKDQLKEVLLAVLGVGYDSCYGEEDEMAYSKRIVDELESRLFGEE